MFKKTAEMLKWAYGVCLKVLYKKRIQSIPILVVTVWIVLAISSAYSLQNKDIIIAAISFTALILSLIPQSLRRFTKVNIPFLFESYFVIFIFASLFLGQAHGFYSMYWWWDTIFHTISGMGLAMIGVALMYLTSPEQNVRKYAIMFAALAFLFAVGLGTLWEVFEYAFDGVLGSSLQSDGINDTMWDCVSNMTGALIASIGGYLYMKEGGQKGSTVLTGGFNRLLQELIDGNVRKH